MSFSQNFPRENVTIKLFEFNVLYLSDNTVTINGVQNIHAYISYNVPLACISPGTSLAHP